MTLSGLLGGIADSSTRGAPAFRDAHWIYLPEPRFRAYRVGFYDRFAPGMAPAGRHGVYVDVAHRGGEAEPDLVRAAIADVSKGSTRRRRCVRARPRARGGDRGAVDHGGILRGR